MTAGFKHREGIQGVVDRPASHSSQIRGWTAVVVTPVPVLIGWQERVDKVRTNG